MQTNASVASAARRTVRHGWAEPCVMEGRTFRFGHHPGPEGPGLHCVRGSSNGLLTIPEFLLPVDDDLEPVATVEGGDRHEKLVAVRADVVVVRVPQHE